MFLVSFPDVNIVRYKSLIPYAKTTLNSPSQIHPKVSFFSYAIMTSSLDSTRFSPLRILYLFWQTIRTILSVKQTLNK